MFNRLFFRYSRLFFVMAIGLLSAPLFADNDPVYMLLEQKRADSTVDSIYFELGKSPILTFSSDSVFVSIENTQVAYSDVVRFTFVGEKSTTLTIDDMASFRKPVFRFQDAQTIVINHADSGHTARMFGLNGVSVPVRSEILGDRIIIHLNGLPAGIYIVQVGETSFKVVRR